MTDNAETIGELIRELREKAGYSRPELGHLVGVSHGTIANIERGYARTPGDPYKPSRDAVVNLAEVLGIDEQRMFDAYGHKGRRYYRFDVTDLSPTQMEQVKGYIDGLRDQ